VRLAVVTRVAAAETGGNLAAALVYRQTAPESEDRPLGAWSPWAEGALTLRLEVFVPGEILVLDDDGREVAGHGRKPGKWDVDVEEFDTIEQAVSRALEVGR
jgi:hypothetical protein